MTSAVSGRRLGSASMRRAAWFSVSPASARVATPGKRDPALAIEDIGRGAEQRPELGIALHALLEQALHLGIDQAARLEARELLQVAEFLVDIRQGPGGGSLGAALLVGRHFTVRARQAQLHDHRVARGEDRWPGGLLGRRRRRDERCRLLQRHAAARRARQAAARNPERLHERLAFGLRQLLEHLELFGARRLRRHRAGDRRAEQRGWRLDLGLGTRDREHGRKRGEATSDRRPARGVLH